MTRQWNGRCSAWVVVAALAVGAGASAGDLHPPQGPVGPTMKSLDQLEPRRCVNDLPGNANAVHVITEPGQYFASGNIPAPAGKSGIRCALPPGVGGTVSIDLNGFEIVGQQGSLHGVMMLGQHAGALEVSNGRITGMGGDGVRAGALEALGVDGVSISVCAGEGVHGAQCREVTITWFKRDGQRLRGIADCAGNGVLLTDCGDVSIAELSVSQCGLSGVDVECDSVEFVGVTSTGNGGSGLKVKEKANRTKCSAHRVICSGNGGSGFEFVDDGTPAPGDSEVVIEDGSFSSNQGDGVSVKPIRLELKRVVASGNGDDGVDAECDDLTLTECTTDTNVQCGTKGFIRKNITINLRQHASGNGSHGVDLTGSTATISGVIAVDNGAAGMKVRKGGVMVGTVIINHCSAMRNGVDGFDLESDAVTVRDCTSSDNAQCGVTGQKAKNWLISNLEASGNGASGLKVRKGGVVTGTIVVNNGSLLRNGADGLDIELDLIEVAGCTASENSECGLRVRGGVVTGNVVIHQCSFVKNGFGTLPFGGVSLEDVSSFSLDRVNCSSNNGYGLTVTGVFTDGSMRDSRFCSNAGPGVSMLGGGGGLPGGRCKCVAGYYDGNAGDGMVIGSASGGEVSDCTFSNNAGAGLNILGFGQVVHRNTFISNQGAPVLALVPGNSVGPLVDESSIATNCNPSANQVR